jgi:hypothetical protein
MRELRLIAICFGLATAMAATAAAPSARPSDMSKLPLEDVNPPPANGATPPVAPMTSAQALDTLRFQGYLNITGLRQDAQGNWWAEAQRRFNGPTIHLQLKRDGTISEQPS